MTSNSAAPFEEDVARAIYENRHDREGVPWKRLDAAHRAPYLLDARAVLPLFARHLAENGQSGRSSAESINHADDRLKRAMAAEPALVAAESALENLISAACQYKATHSDIDREALSRAITDAADYFEAAAIVTHGE